MDYSERERTVVVDAVQLTKDFVSFEIHEVLMEVAEETNCDKGSMSRVWDDMVDIAVWSAGFDFIIEGKSFEEKDSFIGEHTSKIYDLLGERLAEAYIFIAYCQFREAMRFYNVELDEAENPYKFMNMAKRKGRLRVVESGLH